MLDLLSCLARGFRTGDPAPLIESLAEFGDQVGWVVGIVGLDQMVVVTWLCFLVAHDGRGPLAGK